MFYYLCYLYILIEFVTNILIWFNDYKLLKNKSHNYSQKFPYIPLFTILANYFPLSYYLFVFLPSILFSSFFFWSYLQAVVDCFPLFFFFSLCLFLVVDSFIQFFGSLKFWIWIDYLASLHLPNLTKAKSWKGGLGNGMGGRGRRE